MLCRLEDLEPRCHQLLHPRPLLSPFTLLPVFLKDLAQPSPLQTCLWSEEVPPQQPGHRW